MNIAIIGTGSVAYHFTKRLVEINHPPSIIAGRTIEKGQDFLRSVHLSAEIVGNNDLQHKKLDFVIIAVPDREIQNVLNSYTFDEQSILLHTSGAQPIDLLKRKKASYGVLYPLQTFSKEKPVDFNEIPLLIEGNSAASEQKIAHLAGLLSKKVKSITSEQRLKVHLAAVFACNFSNNLFSIADSILKEANLQLTDLEHLVQETIDKAMAISPTKAQTGPATRNDTEVLQKHMACLPDEDLRKLYELHTRLIQEKRG